MRAYIFSKVSRELRTFALISKVEIRVVESLSTTNLSASKTESSICDEGSRVNFLRTITALVMTDRDKLNGTVSFTLLFSLSLSLIGVSRAECLYKMLTNIPF